MRLALLNFVLLAAAFPAITSPAIAAGRGGGNDAIANSTTTSMGEPEGSPSYMDPRSAGVPGSPANLRALQLGQNPILVARCGTWQPQPGCHAPLP